MKKLSAIWTIAKKEFFRFFKDKRMFAALFLPGILIYIIYSFLGGVVMDSMMPSEDYAYRVCVVNAPVWLTEETLSPYGNFDLQTVAAPVENAEQKVKDGEMDAYLVFPSDLVLGGVDGNLQEVKLYTNSAETASATAGHLLTAAISSAQYGMPNFLLMPQDVATEADLSAMIVSMVGPMLVLVMLMTGCVAVAPESIAGEKERGSFATMLVTPVKRTYIAAGKVLSLSAIALLSGVVSCAGIVFSLPKIMGEETLSFSALGYGVGELAALVGIVLSTVLLMVTLTSILSAWAKSVKEATGIVSPATLIIVVAAFGSTFLPMDAWYYFCIPFLNSAAALAGVFSMNVQPLFVLITIGANLLISGVFMWVLSKMFCSEKIMFSK